MDEKEKELWTGEKPGRYGFIKGALCGALVVLLVAGAGFGINHYLNKDKTSVQNSGKVVADKTETKLELLQAYVDVKYLTPEAVEESDLLEGIYKGYIAGLNDPYSEYFTADETEEMSMSYAGEFGGIGVTMSADKNTGVITLLNIDKDAPAGKAGIEDRDVLYKVDGEDITAMSVDEVVTKVRGDIGTEVKITVLKAKTGSQKEYTVVRDTVKDNTVTHEMRDDSIGYIYVKEFDTVTYEQFKEALDDLESQGMKGLVVDLRNNGGGSLTTVCDMLDLILPKGTIVYTEDKKGEKETFTSDDEHQFTKPLAVLVNEYTASASEIFSGAVQDYGLGSIVGTTTYGKGVVQNVFDMKDGSSVKLTIAEYFTPKGRSIQGKGITPEIDVPYEYDPADPEKDVQWNAALEDVRKKIK